MPKSHSLSINLPGLAPDAGEGRGLRSPKSPNSPPPPALPARPDRSDQTHEHAKGYDVHLHSPITSLPSPPSPRSPKHKSSKSLFTNYKANKSTPKITKTDAHSKPSVVDSSATESSNKVYNLRKNPGSTPELSLAPDQSAMRTEPALTSAEAPDAHSSTSVKSSSVPHISSQIISGKEKDRRKDDKKPKFPRLGRKGSVKEGESRRIDLENKHKASELQNERSQKTLQPQPPELPPKTAPLDKDRGFREMMNSTLRNRSADRYLDVKNESSDDGSGITQSHSVRSTRSSRGVREEAGPGFLSSIGNKAAGGFGRVSKGLAKLGRSGSTNERELPPAGPKEPYVCTIITRPLVEQTRITRISKRLEDCRDKTEFWMPALPWRCIDFLNAKAPTSEGIYRVPGSDRDIKHWEQRFDKEHDIDLLHPDCPIYDINTIGSMLKNWLRALPDAIVPNSIQNEVQAAVTANGTQSPPDQAPQELKDALSNLPPFNYYLLFAITCHISLLNAHPETTKMHFNALRICLQPCLRISPLFFQWLVQDWRNCWQGCWTEKEYLEQEYAWLKEQDERADARERAEGRERQRSRQSERTATPAGVRETSAQRERPKTGYKDKKGSDDKCRPIQHFDKFPLPPQQSLSATNGSAQQLSTSAPKATVTIVPQHQHSSSSSSNRPFTAHAPLSTPFDAVQAAHAAAQNDRAISSSGSSKPSLMSFSADGRSTPESQQIREGSTPSRTTTHTTTSSRGANGTPQSRSTRTGSRERAREQGLTIRLKDNMKEKDADQQQYAADKRPKKEDSQTNGNGKHEGTDEDATQPAAGPRLIAAPQLSPMKPLSPMADLDIA